MVESRRRSTEVTEADTEGTEGRWVFKRERERERERESKD